MAKSKLTEGEIQCALDKSDDENIYVHQFHSDDEENFAVDSCSDSESNATEQASEDEDEQLWSDSDDVPLQVYVSSQTYDGRDGMKWKLELEKQSRTRRHNIIRGGIHKVVLPPGKHIIDPIDSFKLFFNEHILEIIVKHTNSEAQRVLQNRWKVMDIIEMQAFIGLLLTIGNRKGLTNYHLAAIADVVGFNQEAA